MYYVTSREQSNGDLTIWQHVKKLKDFKAKDGIEYVVAKNKKEMNIIRGDTLPLYIGLDGKLRKCSSYALYLF